LWFGHSKPLRNVAAFLRERGRKGNMTWGQTLLFFGLIG
jgi:hypothetical protein